MPDTPAQHPLHAARLSGTVKQNAANVAQANQLAVMPIQQVSGLHEVQCVHLSIR